ncbi:hypothetical protein [Mycolicibacterium frederiksbergense]|uniref:hypothetical protein n=1 Tax=Mycolicibacterium frederiksbergense TaxID=117567 RepID=UPI00265BCE4D|nr:hypothetical protein [Mycolicibacterium frederiksbergense]MBX9919277.1 hypothetical protein [Mycolicibacterium frederiksbergense]MDO0975995.1 hypothetical protein [Mycolicibacterium frederiksbergense]
MRVKPEIWQELSAHVTARGVVPPWAVTICVGALVGDHPIVASWATYDSAVSAGESFISAAAAATHTRWSVFVVAGENLVHVELEYADKRYDRDRDHQSPARRLQPTVKASWVRTLKTAVGLEIGACDTRLDKERQHRFEIGGIRLTFANGSEVDLGIDQLGMDDQSDRDRSDTFLAAVRKSAAL